MAPFVFCDRNESGLRKLLNCDKKNEEYRALRIEILFEKFDEISDMDLYRRLT